MRCAAARSLSLSGSPDADACVNVDIDLVDYSNIDVGTAMKMTGNVVLAATN